MFMNQYQIKSSTIMINLRKRTIKYVDKVGRFLFAYFKPITEWRARSIKLEKEDAIDSVEE